MPEAIAPENVRLFIAVMIPDEVKTEMEKVQVELGRGLGAGRVRWASRGQFHLTLRFLGNVEAQRVGLLIEAVRGACQGFSELQLRAQGVGFFPDLRFPRVIWVGVRDERDQLEGLQLAVQNSTQDFTTQEPEERFTGHVTLGRVKAIKREEAKTMTKLAATLASRSLGEWTADKLQLMRSELSSEAAHHTVLASLPLGGTTA
jgi:2'-5' RNA ligase